MRAGNGTSYGQTWQCSCESSLQSLSRCSVTNGRVQRGDSCHWQVRGFTASVGVTVVEKDLLATASEAIGAADAALYAAKHGGRDRVVFTAIGEAALAPI